MKYAMNFLTHALVGAIGGVVGITAGVALAAYAACSDPEGWNHEVVGKVCKRTFEET